MKMHKRQETNEPWGVTPELRAKLYLGYVAALVVIVTMVWQCQAT